MSYSTLVFITFSAEIIWGTKILSEVVFFWNSKFKLFKLFIIFLNKLGIQNFSIWSHLEFIILESKCCFFIWPNLTWSNLLKWDTKWPQMKKLWIPSLIISGRFLQLLHSSFSHLRNFYQTLVTNSWISYRLSEAMSHTCEIWTTFCSNFLKMKNGLYKDCRSWIHDHDSMRPMKQCAWLFLLMPRRLVLIWCMMYDVWCICIFILFVALLFSLSA